jgi:signal transduction histidine kinase
MFYLGWKMFRQKTPGSRSYLLGLFCLASGVGYWTIGNLGWVQRNLWAIHAPILGNLLEIVFLSATLSSSLETFRKAEANEKAATERVDFLKRFIRVLTHDLANPLAIIQGSLRQLLQQKDPVVLKNAQRIERASSQMKGLIDNIRTIQALQSGKLEIKPTSVSLRQAVDNAIFTVSELSEKKNVPVQVIDFSQDLNILADPSSLSHEVLSNLLSNAIKFTEPGETISITVEALENHLLLHIQDRGIGIPPDLLERIFDENASTSREGTAGEKGTGFGMPLVKAFMEAYGGQIFIISKTKQSGQLNHGTKITLQFTYPNSGLVSSTDRHSSAA